MKTKRVSRLFMGAALAAILAFVAGAGGCDETEDFFQGSRCDEACKRFGACFEANYDVQACFDRCHTAVDENVISSQDTDDCLNCIGDKVCNSPTFNCASVCGAFITAP